MPLRRRYKQAISLLVFLGMCICTSLAQDSKNNQSSQPIDLIKWADGNFLYGTYYYPDHWPEARWEEDAKQMQEAGINLIKTGEGAWGTFEPREGEFDFSWLDRAIDVFAAHGIKVMLGTPSYSAPAWLFEKYPDVGAMSKEGLRYRFGVRQVQNFSSPHYIEAVRRIVEEMGKHYANNPNVIAFSIDNEIGGQQSYDELSRTDFRNWLQKKYGTLDELNRRWGNAFWGMQLNSWSQVPVPWDRETPNPSMALDYDRFHNDLICNFVAMQEEILHRLAPGKPTTHNGMGIYDDIDYSQLFAPLTFAAFDHYPPYSNQNFADYYIGEIGLDFTRGSKQQNFMVMEEMVGVGAWTKYFSMNPDPRLTRTWTYQAIAHGADIINYYRWRQSPYGTEQLSFFIENWDGYRGPIYDSVAKTGHELPKIARLLQGSIVKSDAALLVSPESRWSFRIQPHTTKFDFDQQFVAYYKALRDRRVNTDIVYPQQDFSKYKLIIAPSLLVVDQKLGDKLTEFVKNGGVLMVTPLSGAKDENNWAPETALPGNLRKVVGAAIREFDPQIDQKQGVQMTNGARYPATIWYDILTPDSAKAVGVYTNRYYAKQAAITRNQYGQGSAYYVGAESSESSFYQDVVDRALTDAKIARGNTPPAGVEVATREKPGQKIYFVINRTETSQPVEMPGTYTDAFSGKTLAGHVQVAPYDVKILTQPTASSR